MQLTYYLLSIFYIPLILCRFDKRIKLSSHMDEFGIKLLYSYMLPTHANLLYPINSVTYKSSSCSNNVMIWLRRGLFWYHLLTARTVSTSTTQWMQTLLLWCQPQVWNHLLNWDVTDDEAHVMSSGTQFIMDPHIRTNSFVLNLMDRLAALENSLISKSAEVTALTATQSGRITEPEADVTALEVCFTGAKLRNIVRKHICSWIQ